VPRYHQLLLGKIEAGEIDPSFVVTHRLPLEKVPRRTGCFGTRRTAASKSC